MKSACRLYLVRHGQTIGYEREPVYGHTDAELTETGFLQMQAVAERLRFIRLAEIYSSDLIRSKAGARQIARYHDVPVRSLPELREIYFGAWEGMSVPDVRRQFPDELLKRKTNLLHYTPPGQGESMGAFAGRVNRCLDEILERHSGQEIAMVAHGGVNRVILCRALGVDLRVMLRIHQDFGCLNVIDFADDAPLVRMLNG